LLHLPRMAKSAKTKTKKPNPDKLTEEKEVEITVKEVVKDERTRKIAGTVFILMAIFLFIAITSYCFTWKEDQDKVLQHGSHFLIAENIQVSNLLGRLGAYTGHLLVFNGFGLASYLFCTTLLVLGVNFLAGKKLLSMVRNLKYVLPGLLVFSVALAFVFQKSDFSYGGGVGNMVSHWLVNFVGTTGTAAILLVVGLAYIIWQFNPSFASIQKKLEPVLAGNTTTPEPVANQQQEAGLWIENAGQSVNDLYADNGEEEPELLPTEPKGNALKGDGNVVVILPKQEEDKNPLNEFGVSERDEVVGDNTNDGNGIINRKKTPPPVLEMEVNTGVQDEDFNHDHISVIPPEPVRPPAPPSDLELEIKRKADDTKLEIDVDEQAAKDLARKKIESLPPYDPVLDLKDYLYPGLDLLEAHGGDKIEADPAELEANKNQIINTLKNYDIAIQRISATVGPTVTLYEIVPAAGVRISRIKNLEDDIALSLSALGIRIIAPIPGKGTIGIEVPNHKKSVVSMKTLLSSDKFQRNNYALPIAIGKKIDNENFIVDLTTMPHLLMAGATGQGKSVGLNAILISLLYKKHPSQLKFVLIDPKKVELSIYRVIEKHFLAKLPGEEEPIITDTKKVVYTLNALCIEMDRRYDMLKEAGTRNIKEYNEKFAARRLNPQKGHEYLPFIVLVIDEFADLIMTAGKEVEMPIARLAQLARAVGIHLIIATQRPSVNIITGTIKANFPARIAFKVSSKIDSRTILDAGGAEQLIGKGDMLISYNGEITRLQCAFVDTPEVEGVCDYIGEQRGYPDAFLLPEYVDEKDKEAKDFDLSDKDPLFEEAARLIVQNQSGSTSLIQRRMKLGYNRAGRLMDQLEQAGVVGPNLGSKVREVVIKTEADLQELLNSF
jgi:DNA segregation ATPase FtsK/SpoIIIE, S-DNA-T family